LWILYLVLQEDTVMYKTMNRWIYITIIGLSIFTQVSISVPTISAQNLTSEKVSSVGSDPDRMPAGLSPGEWEQIISLMGATYEQEAYLKASNPDAEDAFGYQVALDGDTLVVGAYKEASNGTGQGNNDADDAGAAYVFVRSGDAWMQQAYLKASHAEAYDNFGRSVAIDGDTIVIGAPQEDSDGSGEENNDAGDSGAVYVFFRAGGVWTQQAFLKASNIGAGDNFGNAVAIDGDTVVVGAYKEDCALGAGKDDNSAENSGAGYVYIRSGTNWSYKSFLKASNAEAGDLFGYSVAIDGDTLVVGAAFEDGDGSDPSDNSVDHAGAAYVFVWDGTFWKEKAYLKASNIDLSYDQFGYTVAIDDGTIVIGSPSEDGDGSSPDNNDEPSSGAAYVFVGSGSMWTQQAYLKASNAGEKDYFGYGVAIDGDMIVVGADGEDSDGSGPANNDAKFTGAVYVFMRSGTTWTQQAYLKADNAEAEDALGYSVDVDNGTIIAGAFGEASDGSDPENNDIIKAGAVYVFKVVFY
jgi:hypothetical protein